MASKLLAATLLHPPPLLQVTARPSGPAAHTFQQQPAAAAAAGGSRGGLSAALGTKWAHAVNVRLVLERVGERRIIKVCAARGGSTACARCSS